MMYLMSFHDVDSDDNQPHDLDSQVEIPLQETIFGP
jgi:hypothetical protein